MMYLYEFFGILSKCGYHLSASCCYFMNVSTPKLCGYNFEIRIRLLRPAVQYKVRNSELNLHLTSYYK